MLIATIAALFREFAALLRLGDQFSGAALGAHGSTAQIGRYAILRSVRLG